MKRGMAVALILVLLSPALAFAGSSTDAALALGAFAVFNQIISGAGVFGGVVGRPAVAAPVVYAPAPPVVYAPPPVVYAPPPPVVYAPPPVVYAPAPVVVAPAPPVVVAPRAYYAPVYRRVPHHVVARGWCPPGHVKHGRCY